jgi:hypothetical protein
MLGERSYRIGEVFVPGGLPTVTYDARDELHLEEHLRDYLDERHRILSLSGPTKTGKTVLLRSVIDNPVWLAGGELHSPDEFWLTIAGQLGLFLTEESHEATSDTTGRTTTGGLTSHVSVAREGSSTHGTERGSSLARSRLPITAVKEALSTNLRVLVVADFHYISPELQLQVVRGLKDLVFNGLPVVFASVPHRAYDAVRVEKEMTGRVEQLSINFWADNELERIAARGFEVLNAVDPGGALARRLARESFSSPHLMQDFCLQLGKDNGIRETAPAAVELRAPEWDPFFRARGSAASKAAFDLLARGPRQRADRKSRELATGQTTDIYGVVLAAIAETGPLTELTYEQLRAAIRSVIEEPPQRHEVTRVLEEMARISRDNIEGEPVLDYDTELSTLYIADPFFAYFLRWGRGSG